MHARKRLIIATLAVGLIAALPGTALAEDATSGETATLDHLRDKPVDRQTSQPIAQQTSQPTGASNASPTDRVSTTGPRTDA